MKLKLFVLHFLVLCSFVSLVARVFQLQLMPNEKLESKINRQFASKVTLRSKRGNIYDRNGDILATSVSSWSVFIDPQMIVEKNKLMDKVSKILNIDRKIIYSKLSKKNRFVWIKRKISESEYKKITKLQIKGLSFLEEYKRVYFNKDSLGFLVGTVDIDGNGLSGIELEYDHLLKGKPLKFKSLQDGKRRPLIFSNESPLKEISGKNIFLNIDAETQVFLQKSLKDRVKEVDAKRAWAVVMSSTTGKIISSVQVERKSGKKNSNNIAVSEIHEPGSVLKAFSFTKAVSVGGIKPSKQFPCGDDGYLIGIRKIKNSYKQDCDQMSLVKAFSKSLNTVSAQLAVDLGEEELVNHYINLGFSKKTGVDFPGEASPIFHKKLSGKHHLASISFGYGISLSPLQVVRAYGAIANEGYLVKPHYLKGYTEGKKFKKYELKPFKKVYSKKELFLARGFLSSVVSLGGTGEAAVVPGYLVGGKTGTSQKSDLINGGYRKEVLSSFVGVYPLSKPKYVALIMIDEPVKPRSGGASAGPVFVKLAEFMLGKDQIFPDKMDGSNIKNLASMGQESFFKKNENFESILNGRVPNLRGFSLREAVKVAKDTKLIFKTLGSGKVKSIQPPPGSPLPKSKILNLVLK